jgi:hypothetical protein
MPQPRKSADLHAISGAYARNPKRKRRDVKASGAVGPWKERSSEPHEVWDELVVGAPAGVLTTADRQALEYAVRLLVDMRNDPTGFPASKGTLLVNLLGKLGCLPASRLGMNTPDPKDEDDPAEKYFKR